MQTGNRETSNGGEGFITPRNETRDNVQEIELQAVQETGQETQIPREESDTRRLDRQGTRRNNGVRNRPDGGDGRYRRQQEIISFLNNPIPVSVGIIGLGNIGSHIAINLARMGVEILNLYDSDKVELHNVTSQSYTERDIGKYKVVAVKEQIKMINPDCVVFIHGNAKSRKPFFKHDNKFVAVAVDSMEERRKIAKVFYNTGYTYRNNTKRVVDIRVGGEQIDVFNCASYNHAGTIRQNPDVEPCGAEFVSYVSYIAGAIGAREIIDCIQDKVLINNFDNIWRDEKSYSIDVRNMQIVRGL